MHARMLIDARINDNFQ